MQVTSNPTAAIQSNIVIPPSENPDPKKGLSNKNPVSMPYDHSGSPQIQKSDQKDIRGQNENNDNRGGETQNFEPIEHPVEKVPGKGTRQLTGEEQKLIDQLQQADRNVRSHEMAHVIAGGQYVRRGASFQFQRGPDGKNYAVAGEVSIDASAVPGDPEATAKKMAAIKRAALAPADPSSQDRHIAARATMIRAEALMDIALMRSKERLSLSGVVENGSSGFPQGVYPLPEEDIDTGATIDIMG